MTLLESGTPACEWIGSCYRLDMARFQVGDLVQTTGDDVLRPGEAGIVRKVMDNPSADESQQEYIVEFGDPVMDRVSEDGFRLRVHSNQRIHCYLGIYLQGVNEPAE
jgi:hypothetical protein